MKQIQTLSNGFDGLSEDQRIRKTYLRRGESRSYEQDARDIGELIGGEKNFEHCVEYWNKSPEIIKGMTYMITVKDIEKTQFKKENFNCRIISGECTAQLIEDQGILITASGIMKELMDALCKA